MFRIRWPILGTAVFLLASCGRIHPPAADSEQARQLEGPWIVTSVQRDGKHDPLQVGARMTFTDNQVTFEPKVPDAVAYLS
jgi:hypothetical protein